MGVLAQISLAPPLGTRLIALVVSEAVLLVVVVVAYVRYRSSSPCRWTTGSPSATSTLRRACAA